MSNFLKETNILFKHVYVNYFLLLCAISNLINHFSLLNIFSYVLLFFSLWVISTSSTVIFNYHVKKSIDIKGNKL